MTRVHGVGGIWLSITFLCLLYASALPGAAQDTGQKPLEPVDGKIGIFELKKIHDVPLDVETLSKREDGNNIVEEFRFTGRPGVRFYAIMAYQKKARKLPVYLLVTTQKAETRLQEANAGFVAVTICPTQNNRDTEKKLTVGGPPLNQNYTDDPEQSWVYNYVVGLTRVLDYLQTRPEADVKKTFVIGYSWAGFITCLLHAIDNRPACYYTYHGTGYYTDPDGKSGGKEAVLTRKQYEMYSPPAYAAYGASPIFIGNASTDYFGTFDSTVEMYKNLRCPKGLAIVPNRAHADTSRLDLNSNYAWMIAWQLGGARYPKIGDGTLAVRDNKLIYSFKIDSPDQPKFADVIYSYGQPGWWTSRSWHRVAATKKGDTYECEIPVYDPAVPFYVYGQIQTEARGATASAANLPQLVEPEKLGVTQATATFPHMLLDFEDKSDLYIMVGKPTFVEEGAPEGKTYASIEPYFDGTVTFANIEPFLWKNAKSLHFFLKGDGKPGPVTLFIASDRDYWDYPKMILVPEDGTFDAEWKEYSVSLEGLDILKEVGCLVFQTAAGRKLEIDGLRWE